MDEVTKIVITAGATLGVTVVVGIITWALQAQREHSKWVREKRFDLYGEIADHSARLMAASRGPQDEATAIANFEKLHALIARLGFVGPRHMFALGASMLMTINRVAKDGLVGISEEDDAELAQKQTEFTYEAGQVLNLTRKEKI